ncbi:GNAT family N-acetyltransferase [archaeon]|nr:GNAT family N-acetyltransferase [archaeon]
MGDVVSASKLSSQELKQLNKIYVQSWIKVLQDEHPLESRETLEKHELRKLEMRISKFPEGQLAYIDGTVLGGINSLRLSIIPEKYSQATDEGYFSNHKDKGDFLVCTAIYVDPGNKGVARALLSKATEYAKKNGVIAYPYSRPAGFREWLEKENKFEPFFDYKKIHETKLLVYLQKYLYIKTSKGTCTDPVIGMHEYFGAKIEKILQNAREDNDSCGFCILMSYPKGYVIKVK